VKQKNAPQLEKMPGSLQGTTEQRPPQANQGSE
jgi:hypothetical protein